MRRILLASAALAFSAGMAMAADTADVEITAEQEPLCTITTVSSSIALAGVDAPVAGVFEYTCNFDGAPHFVFTSDNGGVVTSDNGGGTADYGIYLNDTAPSSAPSTWLQASAATAGAPYDGISFSSPANSLETPSFYVGLSEALPVAGNYSDTLTIEITP